MNDLDPNFEYSDTGYNVQEPIRYFSISLRDPNKIRLINVGPDLVRVIQERLQQLVTVETFGYVILADYIQTNFLGRFNIYDLILEKNYFQKDGEVSKEDMTIIKVAFCRILGALFCFGYDIVISTDLARDGTHSTIFFKLRDPQDYYYSLNYLSHKFICIAPYSTDSILLINIPKVSVEEILKIIHLTWSPGIKSKQTLADDERSVTVVIALKLCGNPWTQAYYNSGKNTIQARSVILEIVRSMASHKWRFAANINYSGNSDSFFFQWCPNLDLEDDKYCALVLSRYDRLRCLQVPQGLQQTIKECINNSWYLGLQKTRDYHGVMEYKLGGCPWWADGNDAVEARFFMSTLMGTLKSNAWEVCGTFDITRHNHDKTTFLLRHCRPQNLAHMCISFCKSNRIRLIVSSSEISEESELALTTRLNETIKRNWVSLGPRNYGKSIEWKLEGDPWECEGLYSDQTRCIYLLCLLLESVQPLGWRLVASADVSSKNIDSNERGYSLVGKPEDVHTWFFLYDQNLVVNNEQIDHQNPTQAHMNHHHHPTSTQSNKDFMPASTSVPNLDSAPPDSPPPLNDRCHTSTSNYGNQHHHYAGSNFNKQPMGAAPFLQQQHLSRSVPSVASIEPFQGNNVMMGGGGGYHHYLQAPHHHHHPHPQDIGFSSMQRRNFDHSNLSLHYSCEGDNHRSHRSSSGGQQCLANGRCQTRRKNFMRQTSAGSLPPSMMAYNHEDGYKSDGEAGYRSDAGYNKAFFGSNNNEGNNKNLRRRTSSSKDDVEDEDDEEEDEDDERVSPWNNGYVSDGANVINYHSNKRISRSGKYGCSSSPPPPQEGHRSGNSSSSNKRPNEDEEDTRLSSDDKNSLKKLPSSGNNSSGGDRKNSAGCGGASSSEELFAVEVRETTVTRSRSKGNLLFNSGNTPRSKLDPMGYDVIEKTGEKCRSRSEMGYHQRNNNANNNNPCGGGPPPPLPPHGGRPIDGYRSEGSRDDSPIHLVVQQQRQQQHRRVAPSPAVGQGKFLRSESSTSYHTMAMCPGGVNRTHHHYHHHHQRHHSPQTQIHYFGGSGGNIESCSTQSSSSSASAPPDYATCSGIPPSYDQVLVHNLRPPSSNQPKQRKNNELYYVGEFYG